MQLVKKARRAALFVSALTVGLVLAGCATSHNPNPNLPPAGKGVYFMEPKDGATVGTTFKVKFGVVGMKVEAATEGQKEGAGHHHLFINLDSKPAGTLIPFDDRHMHFGKGQTEAEVKLPPGTYKLTMQFADGFHLSYGQSLAATIKVTVK